MRKPQVEHLRNYITLTLVSPWGCYHVPSHFNHVLFNGLELIQCSNVYCTQNGSVTVPYIWAMTVHNGVNFHAPKLKKRGRNFWKMPICFLVKGSLCNSSVAVLTRIKDRKRERKKDFNKTNSKTFTVEGLICHLLGWFNTNLKREHFYLLVTVTGQQGNAMPLTLLLMHDSVTHDCGWASSSHRDP